MRHLSILILSTSIATFCFCANASNSTHDKKLHRINRQINHIRQDISKDQNQRSHLIKDLRTTEINSGNIAIRLHQTEKKLRQQQEKLNTSQAQMQHQNQLLAAQQKVLSKELRTAYMLGRQPYFKLLLTQQDPSKISRILMYYQYINQHRIITIHQLQDTLNAIETNQQQVQQQFAQLQNLKTKQQREHHHLEKIKRYRRYLIRDLNHSIESKSAKLNQLLHDKRQFEQTVRSLENSTYIHQAGSTNIGPLEGKLPWPTKGRVLPLFDEQIGQSQLKWSGILIKAPENKPVYAIANGKVIFAKWLEGYGLLMIISHSNGYMTLYGRANSLYKKVGDTVHAGDLIATVGRSGGYKTPALYFAIRHNAVPLNPIKWCSYRNRLRRYA